jgi:pilus assembly protein FimV
VQLRNKIIAPVLLLVAFNSLSLTLGRVRGAAIVGQPLDVSIQLQLDEGETAASLCLEAEVFHADARLDNRSVRVTPGATQQGQQAFVRVTASTVIDEPVVTVYLKAGCVQKTTRRYVLLADYPSEPLAAPNLPVTPAVAPGTTSGANAPGVPAATALDAGSTWAALGGAAKPSAANPNASGTASATGDANAAAAKSVATAKQPVRRTEPRKPREPREPKLTTVAPPMASAAAPKTPAAKPAIDPKAVKAASAGLSRLKLDPLVVLAERVASLESSNSAPTAETLKEAQRTESLENSVKALVALAAKNEASLQDMKVRLQQAESERIPMPWIYGLAALLAACLAGIAYLMLRGRNAAHARAKDDWWSPSKAASLMPSTVAEDDKPAAKLSEPAPIAPVLPRKPAMPSNRPAMASLRDDPSADVDVSLVEMSASNFDNLMQSGDAHTALRKGPLPPPVAVPMTQPAPMDESRSINSEQLFDIRQQAEFFVSLGQTDQAVRILENRINDHGESSPLIYLDLLKIFYALGLKTDFRQFREDFNLLFNGRIPEFASFKDEGKNLEDYPNVLAHITKLWNTPQVLEVIEHAIVRDPHDGKAATPFDLAAFRELLLLHAVAQNNANRDGESSVPMPLRVVPPLNPQATINMAGSGIKPMTPSAAAAARAAAMTVPSALNVQAGFSQVDAVPGVRNWAEPVDLDIDLDLSAVAPSPLLANGASANGNADLGVADLDIGLDDLTLDAAPSAKPANSAVAPDEGTSLDAELLKFKSLMTGPADLELAPLPKK